ncbi:MAG: 16S rRNA (cytidine(1402)-2'-O)-methyltransferase [Chloroflexi bacterium]|nr:16S rRNA (cytidine(1402)-2'-O)-methyltransferase [Chloroflexota bacterium]
MSTLYVVATPIGNLSDLTERARQVLMTVPTVAAEDTRVTRKLLSHLGASPRMESLHEHTSPERLAMGVAELDTGDMALVTDAGTPGVSDPGSALVSEVIKAGHDVVPLPGASAVSTALSVTGWSFDRYLFLGFLPRKKVERIAVLESVATEIGPVVVFESPHRLKAALVDIESVYSSRQVTICRELTKIYEEIFRGSASEAVVHFAEPRGEFVIVIEGSGARPSIQFSDAEIMKTLQELSAEGVAGRTLVDRVVELTGVPKNRVYRLSLKLSV